MYNPKTIKERIIRYIEMGHNFNKKNMNYGSLYIQGRPGIGKSDVIKQICEENGYGLKVVYMSILPIEKLTGLPQPNGEKGVIWSRPELVNFDDVLLSPKDEDKPMILFLDDAHLINRQYQNYLFELLIYRQINNWKLGENTIIILAGNKPDDNANFQPILAPVVNRISFCELTNNVKNWSEFAASNNVSMDVISYLNFDDSLFIGEPLESYPWPSPRSWTYFGQELEFLSNKNVELNIEELTDIANGYVGKDAALSFIKYHKLYKKWNKKHVLSDKFINGIDKYDIIDVFSALVKCYMDILNEYLDNRKIDKYFQSLESLVKLFTNIILNQKLKTVMPVVLQIILVDMKNRKNIDKEISNKTISMILENETISNIVYDLIV